MSPRRRAQRPEPERTAPRRDPSGAFRQGSGNGDAPAGSEVWRDTIDGAVRLGYRIVQKQLDFGRSVAGSVNGGAAGGSRTDLDEITGNLFGAMADASQHYFELLRALAGQGAPAAAHRRQTPLSLDVDSALPVSVALDLAVEAERNEYAVKPLRLEHGEAAPLVDVRLRSDDSGRLALEVTVPDDQPPGTYEGAVTDAQSGRWLGGLGVTVREPRKAAKGRSRGRGSAAAAKQERPASRARKRTKPRAAGEE